MEHVEVLSGYALAVVRERFTGSLTVLVDAMSTPMIQIHKPVRMGCTPCQGFLSPVRADRPR